MPSKPLRDIFRDKRNKEFVDLHPVERKPVPGTNEVPFSGGRVSQAMYKRAPEKTEIDPEDIVARNPSAEPAHEELSEGTYVAFDHDMNPVRGPHGSIHHSDSQHAIRTADKAENQTGRVHTVHHLEKVGAHAQGNSYRVKKTWQFSPSGGRNGNGGWEYWRDDHLANDKDYRIHLSENLDESSTHYHSVFYKPKKGGQWNHHFDADSASDARSEAQSIRFQGDKAHVVRVPKAMADWRRMSGDQMHSFVENDRRAKGYVSEEELQELSKKTLGSYVKKAVDDVENAAYNHGYLNAKGKFEAGLKQVDRLGKRYAGLTTAAKKLSKEEIEEAEAPVKSRNRGHGFYGTVHGYVGNHESAQQAWDKAHYRVKKATGETDDQKVGDYLDSAHGRHLAHQVGNGRNWTEHKKYITKDFKKFGKKYDPKDYVSEMNEGRTPKAPKNFDPDNEDHVERAHYRTGIAHDNEITKKKAETYNWGWGQDLGQHSSGISSKTDKGILTTVHDHKTGKISHEWDD